MMHPSTEKPITQSVRLRQGETTSLPDKGQSPVEVSCDDVAKMALSIHEHRHYFSSRRDIETYFSRDLNGSGVQGLYVRRKGEGIDGKQLIQAFFDTTSSGDEKFLYEADLITDQRKDYEPTVNRGRHRFGARSVSMEIEWNGEEAQAWRSDIARISQSYDTLSDWIQSGSEMLASCGGYSCFRSSILTNADLIQHAADGLELGELRRRLRCSKCGKRDARLITF